MKRILSLLLVVALIAVLAVPVFADEASLGGWTDLLEFTSVNPNGSNQVIISGTQDTFEILVDPLRRVSKVDLLFSYGNGSLPTYIGVDYAGTLTKLTVVDLGNNLARAYGNITYAFYASLPFTFRKNATGNSYYDLLSCKISTVSVVDSKAHGTLKRSYSDTSPLTLPNSFSVDEDGSIGAYEYKLIPVTITDWRKFDRITLFGSISKMALNSFRASVGSKGLPYEISYMESIPTGTDSYGNYSYQYISWTETNYYNGDLSDVPDEGSHEDGYGAGDTNSTSVVHYGGSILYTITIDLTGVDRSISGDLACFFTCIADPGIGYAFNVQDASGSVVTADTTAVSWWNRFTGFMNNLFGRDDPAADDFQSDMEQQGQQLQEAVDQMDQVTKPAVEDLDISLDQYMDPANMQPVNSLLDSFFSNDVIVTMFVICLTCALVSYALYGKR